MATPAITPRQPSKRSSPGTGDGPPPVVGATCGPGAPPVVLGVTSPPSLVAVGGAGWTTGGCGTGCGNWPGAGAPEWPRIGGGGWVGSGGWGGGSGTGEVTGKMPGAADRS